MSLFINKPKGTGNGNEGGGNGSDYTYRIREVPLGVVDGINSVFTLSFIPKAGTEHVFKNGMLMSSEVSGDYVLNGNKITFNNPPLKGTSILVTYME